MKKLSLALFCLMTASQANAQDQTTLENKVNALENKVSALSEQLEIEDKRVSLGGRLQIDVNAFDGAYNAQSGGDFGTTIFPRRARLSVAGERKDLEYKMILEFADETIEILLLRFEYNGFENGPTIKFGKIREDISLDALTSSKHMALIERASVANTMSPYFRWGVAAHQYFAETGLRYAFGVHNNDAFGADGNNDDEALSLAYTGRLTWSAELNDEQRLHLGTWSSFREFDNDPLGESLARAEVREPKTRLVNYRAGGELVELDNFIQYGVEAAWQYDNWLLQGEYAERRLTASDAASPLDDERFEGYYVLASYMLTGERKSYSAGSARFNQPKGVADAWEVAARVSAMDATSDMQGTKAESYTLGVSYYIDENTKVMLNGVHSEVTGPGTLALVGTETEGNAITARFHYDF